MQNAAKSRNSPAASPLGGRDHMQSPVLSRALAACYAHAARCQLHLPPRLEWSLLSISCTGGLFYQFRWAGGPFDTNSFCPALLSMSKKKRLCSDASIPPSLSRLPVPNLHPCLVFCNFHSHCFDPEMMMKPETGDAAAVVVAQASWPCSRRRTRTQQRCAACRKAAAAAASAAAPPKKWSVKEHHDAFSR